jgi:hypothetical protein
MRCGQTPHQPFRTRRQNPLRRSAPCSDARGQGPYSNYRRPHLAQSRFNLGPPPPPAHAPTEGDRAWTTPRERCGCGETSKRAGFGSRWATASDTGCPCGCKPHHPHHDLIGPAIHVALNAKRKPSSSGGQGFLGLRKLGFDTVAGEALAERLAEDKTSWQHRNGRASSKRP